MATGLTYRHYILKDHLGSWTTITDAEGNIEQEASFDAWGNIRSASDWTSPMSEKLLFDRGYSSHEHLYFYGRYYHPNAPHTDLSLINMNGRMYDPIMSSFLSVDNYVQDPEFSQNFNRYAYCLNNPLCYVDPDGEIAWFVPIIVGAAVGTVTGGIRGALSEDENMNFFNGAWRGLITGTVGGALSIIGGAGMSFGWNLALGTLEGAATGALDAGLWNTDVAQGAMWGAISGAVFTTLTSENLSNAFKGKGFKTNANVFEDFKAGKYAVKEGSTWQQDALDYFGFEGKFDNEILNPGETSPSTGNIFYNESAFESYDYFRLCVDHESTHQKHVLLGMYKDVEITSEMRGLEEMNTYLFNYFNQGLYPKHGVDLINRIHFYGWQALVEEDFSTKWWHFIYKIPRRF